MTSLSALSRLASVAALLIATQAAAETPLERGRYLMNSVVACGNCHTPRGPGGMPIAGRELAGGTEIVEDGLFVARASNLTPDPETGIGRWTDAEIARAIREGVRPDGRVLGPPMPFPFYRDIADEDVAAIIAYLRQLPPVRNAVARSEYKFPLPPAWGPPLAVPVRAPARSDTLRHGAYLAGPLGHCLECHTPMNKDGSRDMSAAGAGGQPFAGPWGVSVARNLTPHESGLGRWTDAEIVRAIRTGTSRDGSALKPPMAFDYYARIDEADMSAIVAFLRTLPPKPLGGK
ncbi:MAG: c-type cytochrome [Alphaproteobacteria bacterium]|nr:c-type cytochrome [Alphaproteobacteria bacterium]